MTVQRCAAIVFLLCAGAAVYFHAISWQPAHAQDLTPVKTLTAQGSFNMSTASTLKVRAVKSSGKSLWYLLSGPNYTEAVRTDAAGSKQMSFALPSPMTSGVTSICGSEAGRLAVVHFKGEIDVYSSAGALTDTFDPVRERSDCLFDGETLFAISAKTVNPLEGSDGRSFATNSPFGFAPRQAFFTRDHRLAAIDPTEATLNVSDSGTGEWHTTQLMASEIQGFTRPSRVEKFEMPILPLVAVDAASGEFYAVVNGYSLVKGAKVLRFDENGRLLERLRCVIPNSPERVAGNNKDGHFSGGAIAMMEGKLLWISPFQQQVVYFSLN
jgi:hypothetical protein